MRLHYIGPELQPGDTVPLPPGWPAKDHDEPDHARQTEKLESGFYERAGSARSRMAAGSDTPSDEKEG